MSSTPRDSSVGVFLRAVDDNVIRLGVREHLDVAALMYSRPRWRSDELKASVSALLATNATQLREIGDLFDRHLSIETDADSKTNHTSLPVRLIPAMPEEMPTNGSLHPILAIAARHIRGLVLTALVILVASLAAWVGGTFVGPGDGERPPAVSSIPPSMISRPKVREPDLGESIPTPISAPDASSYVEKPFLSH